MRKQTYGRRNAHGQTSSLAARCFFDASSATKTPEKQKAMPQTPRFALASESEGGCAVQRGPNSPASNTRSRGKTYLDTQRREGSPVFVDGQDELEGLVSGLSCIDLAGDGTLYGSSALQPKDLNTVQSSPRRTTRIKSSEKRVDTKLRSRRQRNIIEETQARLDDLKITKDSEDSSSHSHYKDALPSQSSNKATRTTRHSRKRRTAKPYAEYCKPLLDLCSDPKGRKAPTPFQDWADDLAEYFSVVKIAEASYGEVYRLSLKEQPDLQQEQTTTTPSKTRHPGSKGCRNVRTLEKADESVLKIIALKPPRANKSPSSLDALNNEENDTDILEAKTQGEIDDTDSANKSAVADVASEVRLLQHLTPVPGFTNFREIRVVQGRVPKVFVDAWRQYNKNVKKSYFPNPGLKRSYEEAQLWAVVEMQDAGRDVEGLVETASAPVKRKGKSGKGNGCPRRAKQESKTPGGISVWTAWDVFWGVALAVAKGEEWAGFEHRDLHMGNICVRSRRIDETSILNPDPLALDTSKTIGYTGLETTLIDYTLSRAEINDSNDVAFFDLSKDSAIFEGDATVDYQYDIYRAMRSAVVHDGDPVRWQGLGNERIYEDEEARDRGLWKQRHPITNLVWLHFVLFKLTERMPTINYGEEPSGRELQSLGQELIRRLKLIGEALALETMATGHVKSTGLLVQWAIDMGWLAEQDVVELHEGDRSA